MLLFGTKVMFLFVLTPGFWLWEFLVLMGLTVLVVGRLDLEFCGFWFLCFFIFGFDFLVLGFLGLELVLCVERACL